MWGKSVIEALEKQAREYPCAHSVEVELVDALLLQLPWLADRGLTYDEIKQVIYWVELSLSADSERKRLNMLKAADISVIKQSREMNQRKRKVSDVKLIIAKDKRVRTLRRKHKENLKKIEELERALKMKEAQK